MGNGIKIDGVIYSISKEDVDYDLFWSKLVELIEANGWTFGGITGKINEDGEPVYE